MLRNRAAAIKRAHRFGLCRNCKRLKKNHFHPMNWDWEVNFCKVSQSKSKLVGTLFEPMDNLEILLHYGK